MGKDKRIDSYIGRSAEFAKPILLHLRQLVHRACPEAEETMKWSFPHFDYKGILCSMAAFKEHCSFGFWKASIMSDSHKLFSRVNESAMGHLGRIRSLKDLPPDQVLITYIREAARLNDEGKSVTRMPAKRKPLTIPAVMRLALGGNKKARSAFESFSPSQKRDYIEWIIEARTEETRTRRLKTAMGWIAEGKPRNWKYLR